jgi:hypothetical protein
MAKSVSYAVSPSTNIIPQDDMAYDTDFAMYYSLYIVIYSFFLLSHQEIFSVSADWSETEN